MKTHRANPNALKNAATGAVAAPLLHLILLVTVYDRSRDMAAVTGRLTGGYLLSFAITWLVARYSKKAWPQWKYVAVSFGVYFVLLIIGAIGRANWQTGY